MSALCVYHRTVKGDQLRHLHRFSTLLMIRNEIPVYSTNSGLRLTILPYPQKEIKFVDDLLVQHNQCKFPTTLLENCFKIMMTFHQRSKVCDTLPIAIPSKIMWGKPRRVFLQRFVIPPTMTTRWYGKANKQRPLRQLRFTPNTHKVAFKSVAEHDATKEEVAKRDRKRGRISQHVSFQQ